LIAGVGMGGASAAPPRSNDNPDGGGPAEETAEREEFKSKARGGPLPVTGEYGANDGSSTSPSGGVLLGALSGPGSQPGRE
jgi:hypothetical protein